MRQIIGLVGPKGCGKSTLATQLVDIGFARRPFAGPLKEMLRQLLRIQGVDGRTIDDMIDGSAKETPSMYLVGRSPRYAMQTLGTEWGRQQMRGDLWIQVWINQISRANFPTVVEDVRFQNEANAIKEMNGILVRIDRRAANVMDQHVSEIEQAEIACDFTIRNSEGKPTDMIKQLRHEGMI